jgi:metal iron transporter
LRFNPDLILQLADLLQVIGSAIALNLLLHIPLVAGCAITLVDVLVILIFYNPSGSMKRLRIFEFFVTTLVLGVVVCFCIELAYIKGTSVGHVFKGYLPSSAVVNGNGIYLSCGILGATVMPHSIFLGSGIVQSRLREYDIDNGIISLHSDEADDIGKYRPSFSAIKSCMDYSIVELATCLFTFALFVNSAILIVAGASLYNNSAAATADLFGIHALLSSTLAPVAGTIFGLALLLSGTSAGIICTMAGQMVSEGMLNWTIAPWLRRLITRSISIIPSIIIAGAVGKEGLNQTLTASQVVLSVILPFVTAPLIYFTCREKFMMVPVSASTHSHVAEGNVQGAISGVNMKNGWIITVFAVLIWLVLVVMNVALLVLVGLGKA